MFADILSYVTHSSRRTIQELTAAAPEGTVPIPEYARDLLQTPTPLISEDHGYIPWNVVRPLMEPMLTAAAIRQAQATGSPIGEVLVSWRYLQALGGSAANVFERISPAAPTDFDMPVAGGESYGPSRPKEVRARIAGRVGTSRTRAPGAPSSSHERDEERRREGAEAAALRASASTAEAASELPQADSPPREETSQQPGGAEEYAAEEGEGDDSHEDGSESGDDHGSESGGVGSSESSGPSSHGSSVDRRGGSPPHVERGSDADSTLDEQEWDASETTEQAALAAAAGAAARATAPSAASGPWL
jgi:hypothetical protein